MPRAARGSSVTAATSARLARWPELVARLSAEPPPEPAPFRVRGHPTSNLDRSAYAAAFRAVQEHIRRGDCYQVNLTQRFEAAAEGDAWHAYLRLREINPAPFAAYLDLPDGKIVCSSPERFLRVHDGHVETKPIKGTRPRCEGPGSRPRARRGAAHERQGSGRERHDRRSVAQRSRQVLRPGLRAREQAVRHRVVRERASAREHRRRAARARTSTRSISSRRVFPAARSRVRRRSRR